MNFRSLAFRLGALYTLLLSVAFVLVATAMFFGLRHYLHGNIRDVLGRRSSQTADILTRLPQDADRERIAGELEAGIAPEVNNRYLKVVKLPSTVVFQSGPPHNESFDPAAVESSFAGTSRTASHVTTLKDRQVMVMESTVNTPSGQYLIQLGQSIQAVTQTIGRLLTLLLVLLPALIICAASGGYVLVTWALKPVDKLSQTAEKISLQDLSLRLPALRTGDALERLTTSFNTLIGRLRDSVDVSRRFLADASHEIRTPLTVVKGELQQLVSGSPPLSAEVSEQLGSVLEEVARLEHLVANLLALARLDTRDVPMDWSDVDLTALIGSTAEQMRLLAEDRRVELHVDAPAEKLVLHADPVRIKQVIVNLLDNAIRFTGEGERVVARAFKTEGGESVLEIADSGAGIPAAALPFIFDRFYRVDAARSREDGGAGLGLSIVKSICNLHGAQIEVRSEIGQGSVFRVKFGQKRH